MISVVPKTLTDFASDLVLASGPRTGLSGLEKNPITAKIIEKISEFFDNPEKRELYILGPNQSGKSLSCLISMIYNLTVLRRDGIYFAPTLANARAGLSEIARFLRVNGITVFRETMDFIELECGTKLWARGSGDSQRAQVTAPFVWVTEADKVRQRSCDEQDPINQIRARVISYHNSKIIFESTLSSKNGLMWKVFDGPGCEKYEFKISCEKCENYFIPDLEHLVDFTLYCPVCGHPHAYDGGWYDGVKRGKFEKFNKTDKNEILYDRIFLHFNALTTFLNENNIKKINSLKKSKNLNDVQSLYLQYMAIPPLETHIHPERPECIDRERGSVYDEYMSVGIDIRDNGIYGIILAYNPESRYIFISDFFRVTGSPEQCVAILRDRLSEKNAKKSILLYDYGFRGISWVKAFSRFSAFKAMPIRGFSDSQIAPSYKNIKTGSYWRVRTLSGSSTPCVQVASTAGKLLTLSLQLNKNLKIFRKIDFRSEEEFDLFYRSAYCSEVYTDDNNLKTFVQVLKHNHFFDCLYYSICGLDILTDDYISKNLLSFEAIDTYTENPFSKILTYDDKIEKTLENEERVEISDEAFVPRRGLYHWRKKQNIMKNIF